MPALRALLASAVVLAAGVGVLSAATDRFQAFTTETARRISVSEHPRAVPDVTLQTSDGRRITLSSLRGRWLLVDFIYTRCLTYCSVQGGVFAQLQDRLADPIAEGSVSLMSISFDPGHDDPEQLAGYKTRFRDRGDGWLAVRPVDEAGLTSLLRAFGVTAVPDGVGGFVHNVAIAVLDPRGYLVAILDYDDQQAAADYVTARLGS